MTSAAQAQSQLWIDRGYEAAFRQIGRDKTQTKDVVAMDGVILAPGVRGFAGAAVLGGYDSNLDLIRPSDGGGYVEVELGAGLLVDSAMGQTIALTRGTFAHHDITYRSERTSGGALIDHHKRLGDNWGLTLGTFAFADRLDIDRNDRVAAYAQLDQNLPTQDLFIRFRALDREYLNAPGTTLPNGNVLDVNRTFSNTRTETAAGILILKDQRLAPFVQVGVANVDFASPTAAATIDRDATEVWGIAGVRISLTKDLRADVGARSNHRSFADSRNASYSGTGFDGKLVWTPSDAVYAEFNVDRTFEDPLVAGALLTDRTSYQAYLRARLTQRLMLIGSAGWLRQEQVRLGRHIEDAYAEGRLEYSVSPMVRLIGFTGIASTWDSIDRIDVDKARIGAGFVIGH